LSGEAHSWHVASFAETIRPIHPEEPDPSDIWITSKTAGLESNLSKMEPNNVDIQSRFVNALRTQASRKASNRFIGPLPCPYGHEGRIFQDVDQLLGHARTEHGAEIEGSSDERARNTLREAVMRLR
jgi:hypothetical protein